MTDNRLLIFHLAVIDGIVLFPIYGPTLDIFLLPTNRWLSTIDSKFNVNILRIYKFQKNCHSAYYTMEAVTETSGSV